jgi:hypothetical protein
MKEIMRLLLKSSDEKGQGVGANTFPHEVEVVQE